MSRSSVVKTDQASKKRSHAPAVRKKVNTKEKEVVEETLHEIKETKEERTEKKSLVCRAQEVFRHFAGRTAQAMGSPISFVLATAVVIGWALCGPVFKYSENWQLVINTGTTIITFLMIFLVQNTQNRESRAIQLKLDELLRGVKGARTDLVDLEDATDEELEELQHHFESLRKHSADDSVDESEEE